MPRQAPDLPWNLLAPHLEWRLEDKGQNGATSFFWRKQPTEGQNRDDFVEAFVKTLHEHADQEREKYPETFDTPDDDDIVLSDELCERIAPALQHWRRLNQYINQRISLWPDPSPPPGFPRLPRKEPQEEDPTLPLEERKMSAFLRQHSYNDCYMFMDVNKEAFFNVELFKILMMYGEMETLLRIYSHEWNGLAAWWDVVICMCVGGDDVPWEKLRHFALESYILLSLIRCFPDTWDTHSDKDYRNTKAYQALVWSIASNGHESELAQHPHRQFFGIADQHFAWFNRRRSIVELLRKSGETQQVDCSDYKFWHAPEQIFGLISYPTFLGLGDERNIPLAGEVQQVRQILWEMKLPAELISEILEMTYNVEETRRLPVPHDPLHPDNRAELDEYLDWCWAMLVRCEVMGRHIELDLEWSSKVSWTLADMFG
jgi:hypothetical protein